MALKVLDDGTVVLKSQKEVKEALEAFRRLQAEIEEIREETGLTDLEKDAVAYKAAATNYMIEHGLPQVQCRGFHGTLVKGYYGSHWVGTDDELADEPEAAQSLQSIIEKKFKGSVKVKGKARSIWLKITKRVVDPDKVQELVASNAFTVEELAPAWQEKEKQPYLRLFDDDNPIR